MTTTEQAILHYQKDIEKIISRPERALKYEDRLLHCLSKLNKLPVTTNHLQTTGVGKVVNSLRKIQGKKGVIDAAKALVAKWKNMVLEEDEEEEESEKMRLEDAKRIKTIQNQKRAEYSPDDAMEHSDAYRPSQEMAVGNSYSPENIFQKSNSHVKEYSPSKKSHTPNGYSPGSPKSNGIEVYCYSPSKKLDNKSEEKRKKHKSRDVEKQPRTDSERDNGAESGGLSSSDDKASQKFEKEHKVHKSSSSSSSSKHKSSSSSGSSSSKVKKTETDDGIDSLSGTSFAQALGAMIVKKSSSVKRKKVEESSSSSRKHSSSTEKSQSDHKQKDSSEKSSSSSKKLASSDKKSSSSSTSSEIRPKQPSAKQLLDDVAGPSHLAPLDLNMVSTLSVPTPNYKPMPQLPSTSAERRQRVQAEEDALFRIMSNKNKNSRTKVYSGVKGGLNYVPSLYEICCNVLKLHIDALEYTGGIPYSLLKPVLDAASPGQLYQFEDFNPYIIGETDHLWQLHVNKEFRGETREEMETWRDMYLRCVDEREEKYKAVTANIQESLKKSVPVRQTKLAYVDVAKPPRAVLRKQIKNGTSRPDAERLMGKDTPGIVPVRPPPPTRAFERPRVSPFFKPKVAPLMQKTLKSIKQTSRFKR